MSTVPVYTLVNETHRELLLGNYFLPTYPNKKEDVIIIESEIKNDGTYGTDGFHNIIEEKIDTIITTIKENMGDYILWMDADIQFFGNFMHEIKEKMDEGYDLVFQKEKRDMATVYGYQSPDGGYNVGIALIKCSDETLDFYNDVKERMETNEQPVINRMIMEDNHHKLNVTTFSTDFWAWTQGVDQLSPDSVVLHHANRTAPVGTRFGKISTNEQKVDQFQHVREYVKAKDLVRKAYYHQALKRNLYRRFSLRNATTRLKDAV
jgi:hypothetical protein